MSGHRRPTKAGVRSARIRTRLSDWWHDVRRDDAEPQPEHVEYDLPVPVHTLKVRLNKPGEWEPGWNGGQW